MEKEQRDEIKELFQPLEEELGGMLKAIVLYGSAVRKSRVEGSDIDLMVILDDTAKEYNRSAKYLAQERIKQIEEESGEMDLHIQPPKLLTTWWNLILRGEPWAITSISQAQPIYDPSGFVDSLNSVVKNTSPQSTDLRSRKLLVRSRERIERGQQRLEKGVVNNLVEGMTEAAKAALSFRETSPVSRVNVAQKLSEIEDEFEILRQNHLDFYQGVLKLEEEMNQNELSLPSSEIDENVEKSLEFVDVMAAIFHEESEKAHREILEEAFREIVEVCGEALEYSDEKPLEAEQQLEEFRKKFVETGRLNQEYWELVEIIQSRREDPSLENLDKEKIYQPLAYLRDFEAAVESIFEDVELSAGDTESPRHTQITPVSKFKEEFLNRNPEINAIWILTVKKLLDTQEATSVILVDKETENLKNEATEIATKISEKYGFKLNVEFIVTEEYWKKLQSGDLEILSEIRKAISIHDPQGFVQPIKRLIEEGEIENTFESRSQKVLGAPEMITGPTENAKLEALEEFYNAAIELGQSILLQIDVPPPVQKRIASTLRENMNPLQEIICEKDIEKIDKVVTYWKDMEYGNTEAIESKNLKEMGEDLSEVASKVEKLHQGL